MTRSEALQALSAASRWRDWQSPAVTTSLALGKWGSAIQRPPAAVIAALTGALARRSDRARRRPLGRGLPSQGKRHHTRSCARTNRMPPIPSMSWQRSADLTSPRLQGCISARPPNACRLSQTALSQRLRRLSPCGCVRRCGISSFPLTKARNPALPRSAKPQDLRRCLTWACAWAKAAAVRSAFFLCDCACDVIAGMATLEEASVGEKYLDAMKHFDGAEL